MVFKKSEKRANARHPQVVTLVIDNSGSMAEEGKSQQVTEAVQDMVITMQSLKDPGRDFPRIRVMGTLGWIFIGLVVGFMKVEASTTPFLLAAAASVLMCVISLTILPHTPPKAKEQKVTAHAILGLDAAQVAQACADVASWAGLRERMRVIAILCPAAA